MKLMMFRNLPKSSEIFPFGRRNGHCGAVDYRQASSRL